MLKPGLGGGYATHWHQPLCPVGPVPVGAGDRLTLKMSIADAAGQKMKFTPLGPNLGQQRDGAILGDVATLMLSNKASAIDADLYNTLAGGGECKAAARPPAGAAPGLAPWSCE